MPERQLSLPLTSTSVGFIGCRGHLANAQLVVVRFLLQGFGVVEIHHGDGLGADEDVRRMADDLRAWRMVHPCDDAPQPAGFQHDAVFPSRPYPRSDHEIMDAAGAVIVMSEATRPGDEPGHRAAEAIRYGHLKNKTIVVVTPTGDERWCRFR